MLESKVQRGAERPSLAGVVRMGASWTRVRLSHGHGNLRRKAYLHERQSLAATAHLGELGLTWSSSGRFFKNQGWLRMPWIVIRLKGLPTNMRPIKSTHSRDSRRLAGKLYFTPMIRCGTIQHAISFFAVLNMRSNQWVHSLHVIATPVLSS